MTRYSFGTLDHALFCLGTVHHVLSYPVLAAAFDTTTSCAAFLDSRSVEPRMTI